MRGIEQAKYLEFLQENNNRRTTELDKAEMPEGWVVDGDYFLSHPDIIARLQIEVIPVKPRDSLFSVLKVNDLRAWISQVDMYRAHGEGTWALIPREEKWMSFYVLTEDLSNGEPASLLEQARDAWNTRINNVRAMKEGAYIALTGQDLGVEYLQL